MMYINETIRVPNNIKQVPVEEWDLAMFADIPDEDLIAFREYIRSLALKKKEIKEKIDARMAQEELDRVNKQQEINAKLDEYEKRIANIKNMRNSEQQ